MYVCVCVYKFRYKYVCTYTNLHKCICMHTEICINAGVYHHHADYFARRSHSFVCVRVYVCVCMCVRMYQFMWVQKHSYVCGCAYAIIYNCICDACMLIFSFFNLYTKVYEICACRNCYQDRYIAKPRRKCGASSSHVLHQSATTCNTL